MSIKGFGLASRSRKKIKCKRILGAAIIFCIHSASITLTHFFGRTEKAAVLNK